MLRGGNYHTIYIFCQRWHTSTGISQYILSLWFKMTVFPPPYLQLKPHVLISFWLVCAAAILSTWLLVSDSLMSKDLNWRPLDQRRIDSRLVMLYKVTYDLVAIPASQYLARNTRLSRHIHPLSYRQIFTLKDYYRFTFFPGTIIHWNAPSAHIPVLPALAQFGSAVCLYLIIGICFYL